MPMVRLKSLIDGMALSEDVVMPNGALVLEAGTVITRGAVRRLAAAKVPVVGITEESYALAAMLPDAQSGAPEPQAAREKGKPGDTAMVRTNLLRIAHMFNEYRQDRLMCELCRLAIKCAQERLIRV